jgi:hypothetical protein
MCYTPRMEEYDKFDFDEHDIVDGLQDPHSQSMRDIATGIQRLSNALPYKRKLALDAFFKGYSPEEIAKTAGYTKPPPIRTWLRNKGVEYEYLNSLRLVYHLQTGPTVAQRKQLLWKIALDRKSDSAAIRAIDVINRMDGLYLTEPDTTPKTINNTIYAAIDWEKVAQAKQVLIEHDS